MPGFLDANISMYATGAESEFKTPCAQILELCQRSPGKLITSVDVLQEVFHALLRRGLRERAERTARMLDAAVHGRVEPVTRTLCSSRSGSTSARASADVTVFRSRLCAGSACRTSSRPTDTSMASPASAGWTRWTLRSGAIPCLASP